MYIDVHVKYTLFLSDLLKIELFRQISQKCSNIKLHTNRSSGSGVVPERRCSGAELFRSGDVPERRCSGAELFRSGDVPERSCSGAEMFRSGVVPSGKTDGERDRRDDAYGCFWKFCKRASKPRHNISSSALGKG